MEGFGSQPLIETEPIYTAPSPILKRNKKPSGHVAAGKKWDTSEKGRIWKQETIKAKYALRNSIKQRTGIDTFANQRMSLKYAGFIRDGKRAQANRIIEEVVATARKKNKKGTRKIQRNQQTKTNTKSREITPTFIPYPPTLNSAENTAF